MFQDLVSIIIPYFNHKKYIEELLVSIKNQSYKNIEVILIDDGSSDDSLQFLKTLKKKYKFKFISQDNKGVCATINLGLKYAKGKYIKIMDSDDILGENQIFDQVALLSKSQYDVICGGMTLIKKDSSKIKYIAPRKLGLIFFDDILFNNPIYAPTALFRVSAFKKYGLFDNLNPIEDYSIFLQMTNKGARIYNFNEKWGYYRVSEDNYIEKAKWYLKGVLYTLSKFAQTKKVNEAKNYHLYIYLLKESIFNGLAARRKFSEIFRTSDFFIKNFLKVILLFTVAAMPKIMRRIIQQKIIFKSSKIISITKLLG